ncbi:MAG: hypothetical protein AAF514_06895 [Verrucomicrobiota bacterium]
MTKPFPFHGLFSRRGLKILLWTAFVCFSIFFLLRQIADWRGARALSRAEDTLRKEQEWLSPSTFFRGPVPDELNFFASPSLVDLATPQGETQRKRLVELLTFGEPHGHPPFPKSQGQIGHPTDFEKWLLFLNPDEPVPAGEREQAERYFAEAEAHDRALVQELISAASRKQAVIKQGVFTVEVENRIEERPAEPANHPDGRKWWDIQMPHVEVLRKMSHGLGLQASAAARTGRPGEAMGRLHVLFRLREGMREPALIVFLNRLQFTEASIRNVIWEGLQSRSFDPSQLEQIQEWLMDSDLADDYLQVLRLERIVLHQLIGGFKSEPNFHRSFVGGGQDSGGLVDTGVRAGIGILPMGWVAQNQARLSEAMLQCQILPAKTGDFVTMLHGQKDLEERLVRWQQKRWREPHTFLLPFVLPAFGITERVVHAEAGTRMGTVACALERFYLRENRYPEALTELVPRFLEDIPSDPCSNLAFGYQPAGERYRLWSTGLDGQDDQGSPAESRGLLSLQSTGDWLWSYE